MGLTREVKWDGPTPEWPQIAEALRTHGAVPLLRMIDGLPAFPDEVPEAGWNELRLTLGGGMMTLRRTNTGLAIVTWGNADATLSADVELLAGCVERLSQS